MLTWPHGGTDWKPYLRQITNTYLQLADIITRYEDLLVVTPILESTQRMLAEKLSEGQMSRVHLYEMDTNDTWARDHGPISMVSRGRHNSHVIPIHLLDFKFNGWGEKFAWKKDNAINLQLYYQGAFNAALENHQGFVLEGEKEVDGVKGGSGVIGEISDEDILKTAQAGRLSDEVKDHFAEGIAADDLVLLLRDRFGVECVQCNQLLRRPIRKVALCGGSGSFLLGDAIAAGADAFITGEMSYHEYFGHEQEIQICVIGHYQSEQFTSEIFRSIILSHFPDAKCCISEINTNPIIYL